MLLFILFSDSWNLFCSKLTEWYSCSACQMVLLTRTTGNVPLVWCPAGSDHWECTICLMSFSPGPLGVYCLSDVLLAWTTGSVLFVWCARRDMGCIVASGDLNARFWFQLSPFFLSPRTARDFGLRSVATSAGLPSNSSYRLRFGVCMWYKPPQLVNCGLLQSVGWEIGSFRSGGFFFFCLSHRTDQSEIRDHSDIFTHCFLKWDQKAISVVVNVQVVF